MTVTSIDARQAEQRVLTACPDVLACTVVSASAKGRTVTDVFLSLRPTADRGRNRLPLIEAALDAAAAETLRRIVVVAASGDDLVLDSDGAVNRTLMQRRLLAEMTGRRLPGLGPGASPTPVAAERLLVDFTGDGAGTGEMSWGQRDIWTAMIDQRNWLPLGGRKALAAGTTVEDVVDELRYLMTRFPTMRTRLRFEADGRVRQEVFGVGRIALEIFDAEVTGVAGALETDTSTSTAIAIATATATANPHATSAERAAAAVEAHYRREALDLAQDWPVRMAVIRQRGALTHMVVFMNHLVTDAGGAALMLRDVETRTTAPTSGSPRHGA